MAGIPTGRTGLGRYLTLPGLIDILIAAAAAIVAVTGVVGLFDTQHPRLGWTGIIATAVIFGLLVWRGILLFKNEGQRESAHEMEGCLQTLYSILVQASNGDFRGTKIRITIHRPVACGHGVQLLQVMNYVGDCRAGETAGRKFAMHSGVIGEAFRTGEMSMGDRKNTDDQAFIDELVHEWAYTREDAMKLDKSSKSWLAVPLTRTGTKQVEGIVYFDATTCGFFADERLAVAVSACAGIALFVQRRYA